MWVCRARFEEAVADCPLFPSVADRKNPGFAKQQVRAAAIGGVGHPDEGLRHGLALLHSSHVHLAQIQQRSARPGSLALASLGAAL